MDVHLLTPQGDQLVVQVVDGRVIVPSNFVGRSQNRPSIHAGSSTDHLPTNSSVPSEKSAT